MSIRFCCCKCSTLGGFFPEVELALSGMTPVSSAYHYSVGFADFSPVPSAFNANRTYTLPLVAEDEDGGIVGKPKVRGIYQATQSIPSVAVGITWNANHPLDCPNANPIVVATATLDKITADVHIENTFINNGFLCNRITQLWVYFSGVVTQSNSVYIAYPGVSRALAHAATGGGLNQAGPLIFADLEVPAPFRLGEEYSLPDPGFIHPDSPRIAQDGVTVCGDRSLYSAITPLVYTGGTAKVTLP